MELGMIIPQPLSYVIGVVQNLSYLEKNKIKNKLI